MVDLPVISIIVPVYKVEYWLPKCINSLLVQTYKNLEIILVDDGSPDNSGKICDKFAKKDNRIKVIHKENGGVSSARNAGIDEARGDYICFVDSDDWLSRDAIEILYAECLKSNVQICIANMQIIGKRNRLYEVVHSERVISFGNPEQLFLDLYQEDSLGGLVNKLFDTSLIKDNSIRLKEGMKFGEDVLFLLECFKHCKAVSLIKTSVYFYNRLVSESAITRSYPELAEWMLELTKARYDLVQKKGKRYKSGLLYVAKTALIEFEYLVNASCLQKVNEKDAVKLFERAYHAFAPYFFPEFLQEGTLEHTLYHEIVEKYCKSGRYAELYKKASEKHVIPLNTLERRLKNKVVAVYLWVKKRIYGSYLK